VIPAFHEEGTIREVVEQARAHGTVYVVDDGSSDETATRAADAGATVLRHSANAGYDAALATGLRAGLADGQDVLVTMDADSQHDPGLLPRLVDPFHEPDVALVLGVRHQSARLVESVFSRYTMARFGVPDILCGMKAYRATLVATHEAVLDRPSIGTALALAALRSGTRPILVDVPIRPREGASRFGSGLRASGRIARALADALWSDLVR
jgi:glycosyltransferase involved in cell wall biosynthesis